MKKYYKLNTLSLVIFLSFSLLACGSGKEEFNPVGKWNYKVTTDVSYGAITISGTPDNYSASMTTEVFGTLELKNLRIKDMKLTADLDVGGTPARIECDFDGDDITGAVSTSEDNFPFIGERADN